MSTIRVSATVVAAIAALALSALPASPQEARQREGRGEQQDQSRGEASAAIPAEILSVVASTFAVIHARSSNARN